jgi:hypothetical protein
MDGAETYIVDVPKQSNGIVSYMMLVEATENSSIFTQSKEVIDIFYYTKSHITNFEIYLVTLSQVMDNVEMDLVDVSKEGTFLGHEAMVLEGTEDTQSTKPHRCIHGNSRHNKPKKADKNLFLHLVKYHKNEAEDNIPSIVQ